MKFVTTLVGAAALAISSFSVNAAPMTAGGVVWDEFGNEGIAGSTSFQQWFSTDPFNGNQINNNNAVAPGLGSYLTGIGAITNLFNGRNYAELLPFFQGSGYCETGTDCILTFAFGGLKADSFVPGLGFIFDTSAAWLNIYFQSPISISGISEDDFHTKFADAQQGTLWASFEFDAALLRGTLLSGLDGGTFEALLSVTGGTAAEALDKNTGMPDFYLLGSAFIDDSLYSRNGNGQFNSIPEPTSIALLGLGLLGLVSRRRFMKS